MPTFGYLLPTREIASSTDGPESVARTRTEVVENAARAEAAGFGAVWVGDSLVAKPRHAPLVTLAAVAERTAAADVGTAIYLPSLRHPLPVAQATATLDQLAGGRLRLGVGVGVGPDVRHEYDQLDLPYRRRGRLLNEHLDVLRTLWTEETVTHSGEFYDLEDASVGVRPSSEPPVYVASLGLEDGESFHPLIEERIRRHGDGWLPGQLAPETYATGLATFRDLVAEGGREPAARDALLYLDVLVGSEAECRHAAERFMDRYYPDDGTQTVEELLETVVLGRPEAVAERIGAFVDAGVEEFVVRFPTDDQHRQLRRFREVLPAT